MWLAYPCIFCIPVSLHSSHPLALYLFAGTVNKSTRTDCHGQHSPTHISRWISRPLDRCTKRGPNIVTHVSFSLRFSLLFFFLVAGKLISKQMRYCRKWLRRLPSLLLGFLSSGGSGGSGWEWFWCSYVTLSAIPWLRWVLSDLKSWQRWRLGLWIWGIFLKFTQGSWTYFNHFLIYLFP